MGQPEKVASCTTVQLTVLIKWRRGTVEYNCAGYLASRKVELQPVYYETYSIVLEIVPGLLIDLRVLNCCYLKTLRARSLPSSYRTYINFQERTAAYVTKMTVVCSKACQNSG
jgi:hypothetical protein